MRLRVLLPHRVFADVDGVTRIVARTTAGSVGLLPRRLDCVAALAPGLLVYSVGAEPEVCLAADEGVLVKTGDEVVVSVRRATGGADLGRLHAVVEQEYLTLDAEERELREASAKLESGFLHRFAGLQRG